MFKTVGDMSQQIGKEASWYHGLKSLWDEMSSFEKIVVPMGWNVCTNILGGIIVIQMRRFMRIFKSQYEIKPQLHFKPCNGAMRTVLAK